MLILGGPNIKGGPILVAPGSSSMHERPLDRVIAVFPAECEPPTALKFYTRFWVSRAQRIPRSALSRRAGALGEAKMKELRIVRQSML